MLTALHVHLEGDETIRPREYWIDFRSGDGREFTIFLPHGSERRNATIDRLIEVLGTLRVKQPETLS